MNITTVLGVLIVFNVAFTILLIFAITIRGIQIYRLFKYRTYAIILDDDYNVSTVKRLTKNKPFFRYKKSAYNVDYYNSLKHESRRYLIYRMGYADPINVIKKENSRMAGEAYDRILSMEKIKALNTPSLFGMSPKMLLLIAGAVIILAIIIVSGGSPS